MYRGNPTRVEARFGTSRTSITRGRHVYLRAIYLGIYTSTWGDDNHNRTRLLSLRSSCGGGRSRRPNRNPCERVAKRWRSTKHNRFSIKDLRRRAISYYYYLGTAAHTCPAHRTNTLSRGGDHEKKRIWRVALTVLCRSERVREGIRVRIL